MKKIIALLVVLCLALCTFSCSAPEEEPETTAPEATAPETTEPKTEDEWPSVKPNITRYGGSMQYTLNSRIYSHWAYVNGNYQSIGEGKLLTGDDWYYFQDRIDASETAFIVMDPWIDWPDDYLNEYFGKITAEKTLPLIQAAQKAGHKIIILTNSPATSTYSTTIDPGFQTMVDEGKAVLLYHENYTKESFNAYLNDLGINTLIYTGYASNLCVLVRELGIVQMRTMGKRIFFVPECSASIERADTWESGLVHEISTLVISQSQARLLDFTAMMEVYKKAR